MSATDAMPEYLEDAREILRTPSTGQAWGAEPGRLIPLAYRVAKALLRSHPADDGEPCDPAFMRSIPEPAQSMIPSWRDYGEHGFEVFVRLPGNAEISLRNPTRGQLRKLLSVFDAAALGAPLRAGATEKSQ